MGWFRGLSGNELCGHYHQTECNAGTGIVCFEDAIALESRAQGNRIWNLRTRHSGLTLRHFGESRSPEAAG